MNQHNDRQGGALNKQDEKWREDQQHEVDANYKAFKLQLPELLRLHEGRHALMCNREIVAIFDTRDDAWTAANLHLKGCHFSVQKISNEVVKLGWRGYALFHRSN